MDKRFLFKKKNNNYKFIILLTIPFLFLIFFLYKFFLYTNTLTFTHPPFNGFFYIIPDDKGGKKIFNQDKSGLHLTYKDHENIEIINDPELNFSIQILTSNKYSVIYKKRKKLLMAEESIFNNKDLQLAILNTNIGTEYLLLYKNFDSRNLAYDHCIKFSYFLDKCVIVNVKKLD
jgi:hypothetical protein